MADAAGDLGLLLKDCAGGNRRAFAALYDATAAKLFGIVLRILNDRGRAEEVLQEAYLRIWRNADRFDPTAGRPITWMAAIAHNAAIDARRRNGPATVSSVTNGDGDETDIFADIADPTEAPDGADLEALRKCLGQLDKDHRTCVLLAYYEGWSREELSEKFDRPVGTIKTWLHRALAALKLCLGPS